MGNPWDRNDGFNAGLGTAKDHERYMDGLAGASDGSIQGQLGAITRKQLDPTPTAPVTRDPIRHPPPRTTLPDTVRTLAWLGLALGAIYALVFVQPMSWPSLLGNGVLGAVLGAIAGLVVYAGIVLLRTIAAVLAVLLKIAGYLLLIAAVIYGLSLFL